MRVDIETSIFSVIATENGERTWRDVAIAEQNEETCKQYFIYYRGVEGGDNPPPQSDDLKFVYLDSPKTLLLPTSIYTEGKDGEYMELHNIDVGEDEMIVASQPIHGTVAIMVVKREIISKIVEKYGEFNLASPLQYNLMCARVDRERMKKWDIDKNFGKLYQRTFKRYKHKYTSIYTTEANAYITVFDRIEGDFSAQRMLYKAIIPIRRNVDFGLFMEPIDQMFSISRLPIYVRGAKSEMIIDHVSPIYKKIQQE